MFLIASFLNIYFCSHPLAAQKRKYTGDHWRP
jgi:hypothetical protein